MKTILFVDDETPVLAGLRTRLHRCKKNWDMSFVDGGEAAIRALECAPRDVVVTDIQMPKMDGSELLRVISERWPQTVRIVLSGYTDPLQTTRLATLAHQVISKPCEPQRLENMIDRCLALQDLLQQPHIRSVVGRIRTLPTLPRVYAQLQKALADEGVTVHEVAALVGADPAIAAKILQLVNSAFYRLPRRITKIEQAVSYLGFASIRNLTLSAEIFSSWHGGRAPGCPNFDRLQAHSQVVATAASALARKTQFADDALLAGLLHDIGYWVLGLECPADLARAVEHAACKRIPLYEAELAVIGASHAQVGAYLLGLWGLPYTVIETVAHHHSPLDLSQHEFDGLAAVTVAHSLLAEDDASAFDRDLVPDPKVGADYLERLQAPFSWSEAQLRVLESLETGEVLS